MKPLKQWICDVCGEVIKTPEEGYVIWQHDKNHQEYDFKVIHKTRCDDDKYPSSLAVEDFLGQDGLAYLLSFLSIGPIKKNIGQKGGGTVKSLDEFVDFFRRMQVPYYEEARTKFNDPDVLENLADSNEVYPYLPGNLQNIIKRS